MSPKTELNSAMDFQEFNFDGLIGPTHNYAGLSFGNVASAQHRNQPSQPRAAALQGLNKMRTLAALGIGQAILPPLRRPNLAALDQLGFRGRSDAELVEKAFAVAPELVATCYSAASMWTANAATVSPSPDTHNKKLHLSPANLLSTLHRSLECAGTTKNLRNIFADDSEFEVHDGLPTAVTMADEGAANHTRLCGQFGQRGIELFVYGHNPSENRSPRPNKYPSRQSRLASEIIARRHGLDSALTLFWQQHPDVIDCGVFHNDVISVGNQNVFLCHQRSFVDQLKKLEQLRRLFETTYHAPLHVIEFAEADFPVVDAVSSYFFNSQLVTRPNGGMSMICPIECQQNTTALRATERVLAEPNPIDEVQFLDLRQSMNNGGGPACLRLRVVMSQAQIEKVHPGVILTDELAEQLETWIETHYRETLEPDDLRDPKLIEESRSALDALAGILSMELA